MAVNPEHHLPLTIEDRKGILEPILIDIENNPSAVVVGKVKWTEAYPERPFVEHLAIYVAPTEPIPLQDADAMNTFSLSLTNVRPDRFGTSTDKEFRFRPSEDPQFSQLETARLQFTEAVGLRTSEFTERVELYDADAFAEGHSTSRAVGDRFRIQQDPISRHIVVLPYPNIELARLICEYRTGLRDGTVINRYDGSASQFERLFRAISEQDIMDLESGKIAERLERLRQDAKTPRPYRFDKFDEKF